ncbi:MAG TPA: NmrA/HSCARG family protein [Thermoanaerobaculia bacterium]|nr:NmrA/HSCARG family protein [Thermoanaerobaculia bacterium]
MNASCSKKPDGEKARSLASQGAEVVAADYDDEPSLRRALDGMWGVFSLQNTWEAGVEREEEQGKRLARLARAANVERFVYSSVGSADRATGIPHFENKARIEETVLELGFPSYVILRPVFFMEKFISPWFLPGIRDGKLMLGIKPTTELQMIAVSDIGKYALRAFEQAAEMNATELDIAGDERTMPEAAAILSQATGRSVQFVQTPIEEVRKWSSDFATMLEWFDAARESVCEHPVSFVD